MSGTQETALTLARELSGAGEAEEALLELLCQAAEQQRDGLQVSERQQVLPVCPTPLCKEFRLPQRSRYFPPDRLL